jgi:hypothetical protein
MDSYLQGRKVSAMDDYERPSTELLHLICKLRWMGMEDEAEKVQLKLYNTTPINGIIAATHETD